MPKLPILVVAALLALSPPAAADDTHRVRTLSGDLPTSGVRRVELRLPPGTVRIEASPDDRVRLELDVRCESDDARCEERAERMTLESSRQGNTLEVRVEGLRTLSGLRPNVRGRVLVPRDRSLDVDLPVGELDIRGLRGDLNVDVGAGEVAIALREDDVRSVRLGVGIGGASLSVAGRNIEGSGWLGHKVRWGEGTGPARVEISLGVGELDVKLD